MFQAAYGKKPIVEEAQQISAGICVRNFLLDLQKQAIHKDFNLNDENDIKELLGRIEIGTTFNLVQNKNGKDQVTNPNNVKMTYTKSNLKGFVFWFICNLCGRRVKFLYFPPNSTVLACRHCHRLAYKNQNESKRLRKLTQLLNSYPHNNSLIM